MKAAFVIARRWRHKKRASIMISQRLLVGYASPVDKSFPSETVKTNSATTTLLGESFLADNGNYFRVQNNNRRESSSTACTTKKDNLSSSSFGGIFAVVDHSKAYDMAMKGRHGQQLALARLEGIGKDDLPFDPFLE